MVNPTVIFEDSTLLILNKPAGWIVNEAVSAKGAVIQTWLSKNFKFEISNSKLYRSGIVHRLDKPTSGVLIVAKTKEAFKNLQKQFKERRVQKEYLALVHGRVEPATGTIKAPVGRLPWNRQRFGVLPGGKDAETKYSVEKEFKKYSLVRAFPKTGRTHQIRIHMKHIGHSIVSDPFYAGRKTLRADLKWCPRLFLHAAKISFTHPHSRNGVNGVSFESKLPKDLRLVLKTLV